MDAAEDRGGMSTAFKILFGFCIIVSLWAIWQKSERDDKVVQSADAGTRVTAKLGSAGVSGFIWNGTGAISSDEVMMIETTTGVYVVSGHHTLQKGEQMRIERKRNGQQQLCSPSFCAPVRTT